MTQIILSQKKEALNVWKAAPNIYAQKALLSIQSAR